MFLLDVVIEPSLTPTQPAPSAVPFIIGILIAVIVIGIFIFKKK